MMNTMRSPVTSHQSPVTKKKANYKPNKLHKLNKLHKPKGGFTLVEIIIVIAILALLAAIAVPNIMKQKMAANEAAAQATLRTFSMACETYSIANNGNYPTAEADLTGAAPPYLTESLAGASAGYTFTQDFDATGAGYAMKATGAAPSYCIKTGGVESSVAGAAITCTAP